VINRIVNGRTSITVEMAVKLASAFSITPEFWLNTQQALDIYKAYEKVKNIPDPIVKAS